MLPFHFLTSEYPPMVGGVSDYTFTMASALATESPVHVWCPQAARPARSAPGVTVHAVLPSFSPRALRRLGAALDAHEGPRQLFVQWTPQAFGLRSLNLGLAAWLAFRASRRGDVVHLMIHEPFLSWSRRPKALVAAAVHRVMLAIAAHRAARVWVSTPAWIPIVRPFVPASTPVEWLPLPASLPLRPAASPGANVRGLTVGHFGTHSPLVTPILAAALDVVLQQTDARVRLIGRNSEFFRARFLRTRPEAVGRIDATGVLDPADTSAALAGCDVMLQPYPDGVTTRRTSTVTLLALGLPVVTNAGHLSEPFWRGTGAVVLADAPDGQTIGRLAVALLADAARRPSLITRARDLYDARFAVCHGVKLLIAAQAERSHAA